MKLFAWLSLFICCLSQVLQGAVGDISEEQLNLALDDTRYILYVRPRGAFGRELANYWNRIRNSDLSHEAIRKYPPHCSLTGFFLPQYSEDEYVDFLEKALALMGNTPRTINIVNLHQGKQGSKLDYIQLQSDFLLTLTTKFVHLANIDPSKIKGVDFPYHITLRDWNFKDKNKLPRIQKIEDQINLKAQASWSLFLYRESDGLLYVFKEIKL